MIITDPWETSGTRDPNQLEFDFKPKGQKMTYTERLLEDGKMHATLTGQTEEEMKSVVEYYFKEHATLNPQLVEPVKDFGGELFVAKVVRDVPPC